MTKLEIALSAYTGPDNTSLTSATASVCRNASYKHFVKVVKSALNISGLSITAIKYLDDENDEVSLVNDADLCIAFRVAEHSGCLPVRVYTSALHSTELLQESTENETQQESDADSPVEEGNPSISKVGERTRLCRKVEKKVRRLQTLFRREDDLKDEIRTILHELDTSKTAEELNARLEAVKKGNDKLQTSAEPLVAQSKTEITCVPKKAVATATEEIGATIGEAELVNIISERLLLRMNDKTAQKSQLKQSEPETKAKLQFGTACNVCGLLITDILFRCSSCKFYNLCGRCEAAEKWQEHAGGEHLFIKVQRPLSVRQTASLTTKLPFLGSHFFTQNACEPDDSLALRNSFVRFCSDEIINTKLNERELVTYLWIERKRAKRIAKIERCHQLCDRILDAFQKMIRERLSVASSKQEGVQTFFDKYADSPNTYDDKLRALSSKVAKCFQQEEKQRSKLMELFAHVSNKLMCSSVTERSCDLRAAIASLREHYANKLARRLKKQMPCDSPKRSSYNAKQIEVLRELVYRCDAQLLVIDKEGNKQVLPYKTPDSAICQQSDLIEFNSDTAAHFEESNMLNEFWLAALKSCSVKSLCTQLNKYAKKLTNRLRKGDMLREKSNLLSKKVSILMQRALDSRERLAKLDDASYQDATERARRMAQLKLVNAKQAAIQRVLDTTNAKLSKTGFKVARLRCKMMAIATELNRCEERSSAVKDSDLQARIFEWRMAKQNAKINTLLRKIDDVAAKVTIENTSGDHLEHLRVLAKLRKLEAKVERKLRRLDCLRSIETPVTEQTRLYDAHFVEDVTIPDGEHVMPGAVFTKSWRVLNCGLAMWHAESVQLDCVDYADAACTFAASLTEINRLAVKATPRGSEIVISVILSAPMHTGAVRSTWQLRSKDGCFGDRLWCLVEVNGDGSSDSLVTNSITTEIEQMTTSINQLNVSNAISEPIRDAQCDKHPLVADSLLPADVDAVIDSDGTTSSTISRRSSVVSLASTASSNEFVKLPVPIPDCFDTSEAENRIQQLTSMRKSRMVGSMTQSFSSQGMQSSLATGPLDASFSSCVDSSQFSSKRSRTNRLDSAYSNDDQEVAGETAQNCSSEKRSHSRAFDYELEQSHPFVNAAEGSVQDVDAMSDYQVITSRSHSISYCESIDIADDESGTSAQAEEKASKLENSEPHVQPEAASVAAAAAAVPSSVSNELAVDRESKLETGKSAEVNIASTLMETTSAIATCSGTGSDPQNAVPLVKLAQNALTFANRAVSIAIDVYSSMQARDRLARTSEGQQETSDSIVDRSDTTYPSTTSATSISQNGMPTSITSPQQSVIDPRPVPVTSTWMPVRQPLPQAITEATSPWNPPASKWTLPPVAPVANVPPPVPVPVSAALPLRQTATERVADPNDPASRLMEMGFFHRERNAELLKRHRNDIFAVITELLSESDNDWFAHRH